MSSTPTMACSSGAATVSAMTLGFAPGYEACTTTCGGTTSGYSLMGSLKSARRPAIVMNAEMTPAKIGRSMKKLEMFIRVPRSWKPDGWCCGPARPGPQQLGACRSWPSLAALPARPS